MPLAGRPNLGTLCDEPFVFFVDYRREGFRYKKNLEAPSGFEPLHKGFADLSLSHLGTAPLKRIVLDLANFRKPVKRHTFREAARTGDRITGLTGSRLSRILSVP